MSTATLAYNPDQERDDKGRWSPSGNAAAAVLDRDLGGSTITALPRTDWLQASTTVAATAVAPEGAVTPVSVPELKDFDLDALATEHTLAPWGRNDDVLEQMWATRGFDGKPTVVAPDEFDAATQDATVVYRAFSGTSKDQSEQYAEQLRSGDAFAAPGLYGSGIHATASRDEAERLAGDNGTVVRMAIPNDAKTVKDSELEAVSTGWFHDVTDRMQAPEATDADRQAATAQYNREKIALGDPGRFATALGHQAIVPDDPSEPGATYVIQDRSMLIVEGPP